LNDSRDYFIAQVIAAASFVCAQLEYGKTKIQRIARFMPIANFGLGFLFYNVAY